MQLQNNCIFKFYKENATSAELNYFVGSFQGVAVRSLSYSECSFACYDADGLHTIEKVPYPKFEQR